MTTAATGPLAGVRVMEFGQIAAGPFAGSLLADLGDDVVKIERPDGGDGVLGTIALPLAAAALIGPRAGAVWTASGVLWATYFGPVVFRPDNILPGWGLGAAIMTIGIGIGGAIIESIRARAVGEAAIAGAGDGGRKKREQGKHEK